MEIITRWEAASRGKTHFFTGKPCKRGHIVQRYVSTQACVECLNPKFNNVELKTRIEDRMLANHEKEIERRRKQAIKELQAQMRIVKLRVHNEDFDTISGFILGLAKGVNSIIQLADIRTKHEPEFRGQGTDIHRFRIFANHNAIVRAAEMDMLDARGITDEYIPQPKPVYQIPERKDLSYPEGDPR